MAVSSLTIHSPPDNMVTRDFRTKTSVRWSGGTGPFDILYEWDTVNTFDSGNLITDSDTSVTSPHSGTPPSDMGGYGTDWFLRVTITDTNDDVNEIQSIFNDATGGDFTLSFDGQGPTSAINFDDTPANVKAALEGLSNITDVSVTGAGTSGDPWLVVFNDPGFQDVALMTFDDTGLTGETVGTTIAEDTAGSASVGQVAPGGSGYRTLLFVDPVDHSRFLYLNSNVGKAFGPDLADGDPIDFSRHLYLNANVDTNQPCPWLEAVAPSLQVQGGTVILTGAAFGALQSTYDTEIRLYETQDLLGGSFVEMAATAWSDTEVTVTVPNGSSSGFVAVVQTNGSETCDGSAFHVLNVTAVDPDPLMGWWIQTVDKENTETAESTILPYNVSGAGFKKIMGAVGSGFIEIPLSDPDIDSIVDPIMRKGVLIRVYLDNVFRYAFYAEKLSHVYAEEAVAVARITGRGMEVVALWTKVLPHDFPAAPTQNPTWIYGSNENFVKNPGFDDAIDDPILDNPGGEDGNDDDGNAEGWNARGNDLDSITAIQDSLLARTDDWYIEVAASDNHSGMTQSIPVESNRVYHVRAWVSDFIDSGMRVTLALGGADDIAAIGVTYPNNFVFNNEILAELDNVASNGLGTPGGSTDGTWQQLDVEVLTGDEQTSLTITIQNDHHLTGVFQDFGVDDVTIEGWGLGLDPWVAYAPSEHATNSFRLDDSIAFDGSELSVSVNPLSSFAGIQQIITLNPNAKYQFSAWLHTSGITAGDTWRLVVRLNDGNETFIADSGDIEPGVGVWTNFAFVATTPNIEDVEVILRFAYTGPNNPGPVNMDSFAVVPGEPPSSAGTIVNDILDAMDDAGKLQFLQRTWTGAVDDVGDPDTDLDSNGKPWPSLLSLDISPTESLLGVLNRLTALGHEWEIVPIDFIEGGDTGFELNLFTARSFNPDSGIGLSQLASTSPVITPGDATMSGQIIKTAFNTNTIFAIGDDGIWSSSQQFPYETGDIPVDDPAPLGYRESFGIIEEVITVSASDTTTIGKYADARLADEQAKESQLQLRMQRASDIRPFLDFGVGDSIYIDMPPHNADPMDATTGLRAYPKRIRAISANLKGEGADVTFDVDANRVVYEEELAWLAMIAQLAERSPAENTGVGTGTVSGTGGVVSIIGGSSGTSAHQHKLGSSEITDRTLSGDVSGTLPGPVAVNKVKGMAVSNTIPTEAGSTVLVWDYDLKQWVPSTFQTNFPLTGSWTFRTDTGTTPTAGRLNFDDTTTADVLNIYVNELDSVSHDRSLMFGELSDGDDVWVWEGADVGSIAHFVVDGTPSLASDVWTIPVAFVASDGTTPWSQNTAIRLGFLVATSGGGGGGGGGGSGGGATEIISFDPGNITDIPDNADSTGVWNDWPNATVSQTIGGFDGDDVLVDATIWGVLQEPDNVVHARLTISLDDGSTWDDGASAWMKRPGAAQDRANISGRHSVSGVVTTNIIIKAQYMFDGAGNEDANDFHVRGFVNLNADASGGDALWTQDVDDDLTTLDDITSFTGTWSINGTLQCVGVTSQQCRAFSDVVMSQAAFSIVEVEVEISADLADGNDHIRIGFQHENAGSAVTFGLKGSDKAYWEADAVAGLLEVDYTIPTPGTWVKLRMVAIGIKYVGYIDGVRFGHVDRATGVSGGDWSPYIVQFSTTAMTLKYRNFKAWSYNLDETQTAGGSGVWEDWIDVDAGIGFENSWVNFGSGLQDAEYRKHSDGMVHVRGIIKSGTVGESTPAFSLPSGYRPAIGQVLVAVQAASPYGWRADIASDGDWSLWAGGNNGYFSFNFQFDSTGGS